MYRWRKAWWTGLGHKVQDHLRHCSRLSISTRRVPCESYTQGFEAKQYFTGDGYESKDLRLRVGKCIWGRSLKAYHTKSGRNLVSLHRSSTQWNDRCLFLLSCALSYIFYFLAQKNDFSNVQWIYGARVCGSWTCFHQVRCLQLRSDYPGDCDRKKKQCLLTGNNDGSASTNLCESSISST